MPPFTLALLTTVLHMQGADATITSDNKGIEDLLGAIRSQLQQQDPNLHRIIEAAYAKSFSRTGHEKGTYVKRLRESSGAASYSAKPSGGSAAKPEGGTSHR